MPGNLPRRRRRRIATAAANGFTTGGTTVVDPEPVPGQPSQLQVTITDDRRQHLRPDARRGHPDDQRGRRSPTTRPRCRWAAPATSSATGPSRRSARSTRAAATAAAPGPFWANVGSPQAAKSYGDAYQDGDCASSVERHRQLLGRQHRLLQRTATSTASRSPQPVTNLTIQAFDPASSASATSAARTSAAGPRRRSTPRTSTTTTSGPAPPPPSYQQDDQLYASGPDQPVLHRRPALHRAGQPAAGHHLHRAPARRDVQPRTTRRPSRRSPAARTTFKGFSGDLYTALNQYTPDQRRRAVRRGAPVAAATGAGGYQPRSRASSASG